MYSKEIMGMNRFEKEELAMSEIYNILYYLLELNDNTVSEILEHIEENI